MKFPSLRKKPKKSYKTRERLRIPIAHCECGKCKDCEGMTKYQDRLCDDCFDRNHYI